MIFFTEKTYSGPTCVKFYEQRRNSIKTYKKKYYFELGPALEKLNNLALCTVQTTEILKRKYDATDCWSCSMFLLEPCEKCLFQIYISPFLMTAAFC